MLNLNSLLLFSEKPEDLVKFYTKVFGVEPSWSGGDFAGFKVGSGMLIIGPHSKVKGTNTNPERIMFNLETENVEEEFKRIKDAKAIIIQEPYHPGEEPNMLIATFADPDGNFFQIGSPMKS